MTAMTVATRVRRRSSRERIVCDSVSAAVGLGVGPAISGRGAGTVAIASYSTQVSLHPVGGRRALRKLLRCYPRLDAEHRTARAPAARPARRDYLRAAEAAGDRALDRPEHARVQGLGQRRN